IKRYFATRDDKLPWLFVSERGQPMTRQAVNYLIVAAAKVAGLKNVYPHTLRHSCGYYLADRGTDLLCRTTLAIATRVIPSANRGFRGTGSKGRGSRTCERCDVSWPACVRS